MKENSWTVVQFTKDNSVEAVPTNWIFDGDKCLWPPYAAEKLTLAIKTCQMNTHWPSYNVKSFTNATYDNYETARRKAKLAEETSDLNTDCDVPKKRRSKRRIVSSSEEEVSDEIYIEPPPKFYKKANQPAKKGHLSENQSPYSTTPTISHHQEFEEETRRSAKKDQRLTSKINFPAHSHSATSSYDRCQLEEETRRSAKKDDTLQSEPDLLARSHSFTPTYKRHQYEGGLRTSQINEKEDCGCCSLHVKHVTDILKSQRRNNDLLTDVLNLLQSRTTRSPLTNQESVLSNLKLPAQNEEEFQELETVLKEKDSFEIAVQEMVKVGGKGNYDFVKRTLKMLLSDQLACAYSYYGRREKKGFSGTKTSELITVAANRSNNAKDFKETEENIKQWLRRAADRKKRSGNM